MKPSRDIVPSEDARLTVGIISDTHGQLDPKAYAALAECDRIIHAGDIGGPAILHELETLAPVTAVLGNNDYDEYGSEVGRFAHPVIGGVRFLVAHYPRDVRIGFNGSGALAPGDPIPQVCVHGHTHVPELVMGKEARPAEFLICPGAAFRPRGGFPRCIGRMTIEAGRIHTVRIESLDGRVVFEA
ncbi:metallophosphoesterase family protein [Raoultibacter phocaeensis]|uniref:metallophosphoesterase family protein n=1 Tax=Raoultibacter phocaeensis TaxID=2479841 RepID=UPI00111BC4B7|nr:metallophosphoesterase family protein [Raoultibacter phocaeensis]